MIYKYYNNNENFEHFACGRVIHGKAGFTNYPVRIAGEVFKRCLEYSNKKDGITIYDPCCGGGYLLTVLGLLNPDIIKNIYGSDISNEAISLARENLSLLTFEGLLKRKQQINDLIAKLNKQSHKDALKSVEVFLNIIKNRKIPPQIHCFIADILDKKPLEEQDFKTDILITDVPYGNLVSWSGESDNAINQLLDNVIPVLHKNTILAISTDKGQKIKNDLFVRHEKLKIGKRVIYILQLKE